MSAIVLYDAECPLCRNLAAFAARHARGPIAFKAWQSFRGSPVAQLLFDGETRSRPADSLRVLEGGHLRAGPDAWAFLLEAYPALRGLGWLASQLGLQAQVAATLDRAGHRVRRACCSCRRHHRH